MFQTGYILNGYYFLGKPKTIKSTLNTFFVIFI